MRWSLSCAALLCATTSLLAQTPAPRVEFVGCGGQSLSGAMAFTGDLSRNLLVLTGGRTGSTPPSSYTIYWGNDKRQDNATFPLQHSYSDTQANYSFQILANMPDGSSDCVQGRVLFLPSCVTNVQPTLIAVPSTGGTVPLTLTQSGSCTVPISDDETWIAPQTPSATEIKVDISANTGTVPRTGLLHIAENVVTFHQAAPTCTAKLSSHLISVGAAATSPTVNVTIPAGCAWTISGAPSWLTPSPVSGGTGSQTITLNLTANTSPLSRSASLKIAGQRLDVTQAGTQCLYTISPSSRNVPPEGETSRFKISAAAGCGWTAVPTVPWITIIGNASGSGLGEIQFSVSLNPSFTTRRTGAIRIAGQTFVVTQMLQGPNMRCAAQEVDFRQLRLGGSTELLPDLVFDCSGTAPSGTAAVEFTLRLNVPVTSKIVSETNEFTEALLMIDYSGSGTQTLGGNVRMGRIAGPNALRWRVPLGTFLADNELQLRFANVRANTAALTAGAAVTAILEMKSVDTISAASGPYRMAQALDPTVATVGTPNVGSPLIPVGNVRVPVSVTEQFLDVFKPKQENGQEFALPGQYHLSESGYMHSGLGNPAIGTATSGTRILVRIPGIPAGVRVFADYVSVGGQARLTSADTSGSGGGVLPIGNSPRELTVAAGQATATWEIVAATTQVETVAVNLYFSGATAAQIQTLRAGIEARLAPVSGVATASGAAPIPRFLDPLSADAVNLRIIAGAVFIPPVTVRSGADKAPVLMARGYEQVGSNFVFNYDVYNDSSSAADATVVRGNAPPGFQYVSCTGGTVCNVSNGGSSMEADLGTMAPGASTTVQVQATQTENLPPGTYVENSLDVSTSDLDTDVDSNSASGGFIVEQCAALAVASAQFQSPGGAGTANAPAGCTWNATSTVDWISLTGATSGSASGPVTYTVQANASASPRTGSIIIGGRTFTITQGAFCSYSANTPGVIALPAAGATAVSVFISGAGCTWTATPGQAWLSASPGSSAAGTQNVILSWQANPTTSARSAAVSFGDVIHTAVSIQVNQGPAPCTFALGSTSATAPLAGGSSTFNLTSNGGNCAWTASSDSVWLTVTPPSGLGGGTLTWTAAANSTTAARTGTITVGGQTFTVTQAGTCTATLTPPSTNVGAGGGFGVFGLSIGAGCAWTALSSQPWLTVGPDSGTGPASLNWNVSTNTTMAQRSATVTVAGQTFTVTQAAGTCTFTLGSASALLPHQGGAGTVTLTASNTGCEWTARSNTTWAQVSPISGTGSATLGYTVFPNFNTTARTAQLTIAGQTFTIAQNANPGTTNQRFVRLLYFSFLGRVPTEDEVNFHANSGLARGQLAMNFLRAEEFNIGGRFTAGLYVGLLNRDAEYGGWQFQRNALSQGYTNQWAIIDSFINSAEYRGKFGTPNDVDYVRLLYRYVLLREAGPGEAEFHASTIPALQRSGVARSFLNSPEFRNGTQARLNAFLTHATLLLRDGSPEELQFRRQQLEAGGDTALQGIVDAFVGSAEMENVLR